MNIIDLSIFSNRINSICAEMGAALKRAAFSPNIKDRLDYSCAIFDQDGNLCAQAAHIPVHLGSMAYAMKNIIRQFQWQSGDMLILNDPFLGGTHLPDVTVIAAMVINNKLYGYIANRAHHADIGGESPGSMPVSTDINQEGLLIRPEFLVRSGQINRVLMDRITNATRNPEDSLGDFSAQISANKVGLQRLAKLIAQTGSDDYLRGVIELDKYATRLALTSLKQIPNGCYRFTDYMDDDGAGRERLPIQVAITLSDGHVDVDFSGSAEQVNGNINCPLSVTAAAVYYVFRCLMPDDTPASAGAFKMITIKAKKSSLIHAQHPAAVAAGNVETSTRLVDVLLGALSKAIPEKIPAASHGSMNNVAMGASHETGGWSYYETLGGGMGASTKGPGISAVQTHMTNTLNTPVEVLESIFPIRITRYQIRRGSGGNGKWPGGDGLIREYQFLQPASITLLTERRKTAPWGLNGGAPGKPGVNLLNGKALPAKIELQVNGNDCLVIKTPGGGGYGNAV